MTTELLLEVEAIVDSWRDDLNTKTMDMGFVACLQTCAEQMEGVLRIHRVRALPSSPDEKSAQAAAAVNTAEGMQGKYTLASLADAVRTVANSIEASFPPSRRKTCGPLAFDHLLETAKELRFMADATEWLAESPPASASMSAGVKK